jgi:hypothetical protein
MTTATAPTAHSRTPQLSYTHRQILVIMSGLMLGMFLAALDQTIVATALTRISEDLHHLNLYSWVVTSYLLTSTVTTPLTARFPTCSAASSSSSSRSSCSSSGAL